MSTDARHTRRKRTLSVAGAVLAACGIAAIVVAACSQVSAPQPPASASIPVAVAPSSASPTAGMTSSTAVPRPEDTTGGTVSSNLSPKLPSEPSPLVATPPAETPQPAADISESAAAGPILPRSTPTHLSIPAIGVESSLTGIGLEPNGEITTPPLARDSHAYWLDVSPTPGQLGPSVILGHVDSAKWGPAVFFDLGKLRQHDRISVTRADHTVAVFEVTHVNEYKKAQFPTQAVYGNTDYAALRLMTCGGLFDAAARSYESDIVVYAALVSSH